MRFVAEKTTGESVLIEAADKIDAELWASRHGYSVRVKDADAYERDTQKKLGEAFTSLLGDETAGEIAAAGRGLDLGTPIRVPRQEAEILRKGR